MKSTIDIATKAEVAIASAANWNVVSAIGRGETGTLAALLPACRPRVLVPIPNGTGSHQVLIPNGIGILRVPTRNGTGRANLPDGRGIPVLSRNGAGRIHPAARFPLRVIAAASAPIRISRAS